MKKLAKLILLVLTVFATLFCVPFKDGDSSPGWKLTSAAEPDLNTIIE